MRTTPSVAPSVSASGFSWLTASTRSRAAQPLDDLRRDRAEVRSRGRLVTGAPLRRRSVVASGRRACAAGRGAGGDRSRPTAAPRPGRLRGGSRATGVGSVSPTAASGPGTRPASSSSRAGGRACRARPCRRAGRAGPGCAGAAAASRARGGRTASRGERRSVASRSAGWPMTLTQTLAWRRSGGRLDARDRREPDPRVRDLTADDRPDLLAEKLVDPLGSLAHRRPDAQRPDAQLAATRLTVCGVKHSMMSPSSRSWKFASPMPHSKFASDLADVVAEAPQRLDAVGRDDLAAAPDAGAPPRTMRPSVTKSRR